MKVKEVMHGIIRVPSSATVVDAAVVMDAKDIAWVLVEENGVIVGIVTEKDLLRKIVAKGIDPSKVRVKDIESSPLITIDENSSLSEASEKMARHKIRRLVVTSDSRFVGVITAKDISNNVNYLLTKGAMAYLPSYYP